MYGFYNQRILVFKNYDYTQRLTFHIYVRYLKFHICVFIGVMSHLSPVKDIKNILEINISLGHALFPAMPSESHTP